MVSKISIYEPIFRTDCDIFIGDGDRDVLLQHISRLYKLGSESVDYFSKYITDKTNNGAFHKLVSDDGSTKYVIWVSNHEDSDVVDTINHELFHMNTATLLNVGVTHIDETDEVYAYYYGYWMKQFYKKFNKLFELEQGTKNDKYKRRSK